MKTVKKSKKHEEKIKKDVIIGKPATLFIPYDNNFLNNTFRLTSKIIYGLILEDFSFKPKIITTDNSENKIETRKCLLPSMSNFLLNFIYIFKCCKSANC